MTIGSEYSKKSDEKKISNLQKIYNAGAPAGKKRGSSKTSKSAMSAIGATGPGAHSSSAKSPLTHQATAGYIKVSSAIRAQPSQGESSLATGGTLAASTLSQHIQKPKVPGFESRIQFSSQPSISAQQQAS